MGIASNLLLDIGHGTTGGHDAHCFVPTASALDLKNQGYGSGDGYLSDDMYYNVDNQIANIGTVNGNTISSALSPFQAVITGTSNGDIGGNLPHESSLNQEFGDFMIRKITGADPNFNCLANSFCNSNLSITGTDIVCMEGTYTIPDIPDGVNIEWTIVNDHAKITNGQGTNSITISKRSSGNDTVKATLTSPCGAILNVSKSIQVGSPITPFDIITYLPLNADCYETDAFYVFKAELMNSHDDYPSSYQWSYRVHGTTSETIVSPTTVYGSFTFPNTGIYDILARPVNSCGVGASSVKTIAVVPGGSCSPFNFQVTISPNPATSYINVTIDSNNPEVEKQSRKGKISFLLYNMTRATLVRYWIFDDPQKNTDLKYLALMQAIIF